ncbi:MAG: cobalamin-binding protein [Candidatus Lokiarchaeota archaeon]|nr:cobalamin-binding protein [Candidatus Lokiarchaeota archaeon]
MNENEIISILKENIIEGFIEESIEYIKLAIDKGIEAKTILNEAIIKGAGEVGKKYENKEYFLADMILAGDAINECMNLIKPILKANNDEPIGTIMIGTPEGDIHDIGKTLIISLLQGQGFNVIDLGVDIPPSKFVEEAKKVNPDIIGMSGLITVTISKMRETVVELKNAGITSKIILGGGVLSEETCKSIGADAWTKDGWEGVRIIKNMLGIKGAS